MTLQAERASVPSGLTSSSERASVSLARAREQKEKERKELTMLSAHFSALKEEIVPHHFDGEIVRLAVTDGEWPIVTIDDGPYTVGFGVILDSWWTIREFEELVVPQLLERFPGCEPGNDPSLLAKGVFLLPYFNWERGHVVGVTSLNPDE